MRGKSAVTVRFSVDAGAECVRLRVTGANRARDHRVRVLIRTGLADARVVADAAFGLDAVGDGARDHGRQPRPLPFERQDARDRDETPGGTVGSRPIMEDEAAAAVAPADGGADAGPTAGVEDPDLPGSADQPVSADTDGEGGDRV